MTIQRSGDTGMHAATGNERSDDRATVVGSGVYIDVENLRSDGQRLIESLLDNWPPVAPVPVRH